MTRTTAADEFRRLRALFITRQHSLCTVYGQRATVDQFNIDAGRYLAHVCGNTNPTPADYVEAARAMLGRVMSDHEAHAA